MRASPRIASIPMHATLPVRLGGGAHHPKAEEGNIWPMLQEDLDILQEPNPHIIPNHKYERKGPQQLDHQAYSQGGEDSSQQSASRDTSTRRMPHTTSL